MPSLNFDENPAYRPRGQWHRAFSGAGAGFIIAVILVLVFAAAYLVLHHGKRTPIFQSQADSAGPSNNAKPSPAIPFGAKPKLAPPPTVAPLPADSVPPVITETEAPGAAPVVVKAKDTEGIYAAKHQKSFGRGCDGRLELSHTGLDFTCTSGSEAPLHFVAAAIKGPNGNGIELKTGEKYHFDLRRGKVNEQEIFRDWAYTHVPGAYVASH
jgi:hypothetical protein